jgi:hypothetical protein
MNTPAPTAGPASPPSAPDAAPAPAAGDAAAPPAPTAAAASERGFRPIAERWFLERLAFIGVVSLIIGIAVLVSSGNPAGFLVAPLGVLSVYVTASWFFNVGRMKREAFVDEPSFAWKLFFAETYKFGGILLAAILAAALVSLVRNCGN